MLRRTKTVLEKISIKGLIESLKDLCSKKTEIRNSFKLHLGRGWGPEKFCEFNRLNFTTDVLINKKRGRIGHQPLDHQVDVYTVFKWSGPTRPSSTQIGGGRGI